MKEYIEKIIEIILDNVSCAHQEIEEFPHGPKFDHPTYSLEDEKVVIKKCLEAIPARLIERPEITEEFIKEQARELHNRLYPPSGCDAHCYTLPIFEDFISSLLNELAAKINLIGPKKMTVNEEFINEQVKGMEQLFLNCDGGFNRFMLNMPRQLQAILKKLDIEIKEES